MPFMEPQITEKQDWFAIETTDGTTFVPVKDVGPISPMELEKFQPFVDSGKVIEVTIRRNMVGYRLSAPGYMDRTDWGLEMSKKKAKQALLDEYGNDEDDPNGMNRAINAL